MSDGRPAPAGFLQGRGLLHPSVVPRAWNAAFSRGSSYEPIPPGRHISRDAVHGYFLDFTAKTNDPSDDASLLPAALAQLGLGWWERHIDGDAAAPARVLEVADALAARAVAAGDGLLWQHDVAIEKYRVAPPFVSALAQGQAASLFVRAARLERREAFEALARRAVEPLVAPGSELVASTRLGPVLEEIATNPRSYILNGWISALWGLRDVAVALGDDRIRHRYDASCDALRRALPLYDVGWWSKYSLYPTVPADLAKPIYHRLHVDQLSVLASLSSDATFARFAERWRSYDTRVARVRVVLQKARFVVAFSRGKLRFVQSSLPSQP